MIDQVILLEKVQKGLDDSANGRINSKEQAKEKLSKWFKKSGQIRQIISH